MNEAKRMLFIKDRLADLNKTQVDLAKYIDIQPPHLTKVIDGTRKIQIQELTKMAKFLEYDLESLAKYISGESNFITAKENSEKDNSVLIPYMNVEASAGQGLYAGCEYIQSYLCVSPGQFEN